MDLSLAAYRIRVNDSNIQLVTIWSTGAAPPSGIREPVRGAKVFSDNAVGTRRRRVLEKERMYMRGTLTHLEQRCHRQGLLLSQGK